MWLKYNPNCAFIMGGDVNAGDIDWDFIAVHEHSQDKLTSES